ncbi:phenylalanine 4-monooxygenase [Craterilacuibacter sp.]|uniref:phenylalanine 4-monooxygenase n=1 Tax=Craterilacuibacter sp. TaxID=2870909 RepID=UPI003F2B4C40
MPNPDTLLEQKQSACIRTPTDIQCSVTPAYSASERETWRTLFLRQQQQWPERACSEYLCALEATGLDPETIPSLGDISGRIQRQTGWQLERVAGIVPDDEFFAMLAARVFPSTDFIRQPEDIDYTPAPDMFHDLIGHVPLLTHPQFSAFFERFGRAGSTAFAQDHPARLWLARIYWYTVEFGLLQTREGLRIYGAGILSSPAEVKYSLSEATTKLPFDIERIAQTPYDVWHMQDTLFVIDSFAQLENEFARWTRSHGLA